MCLFQLTLWNKKTVKAKRKENAEEDTFNFPKDVRFILLPSRPAILLTAEANRDRTSICRLFG